MTDHDAAGIFAGSAEYYARYRPAYPSELFEHLRWLLGLDGTQTVLDLGCGPGRLTFPLAELVGRVVAVDPNPDMLATGERLAAERGVGNIEWRSGDSTRLAELALPPLDLVTMASSFHWMDGPATLACLDRLVGPGGAVVIVGTSGCGLPVEPREWSPVVERVQRTFSRARERAAEVGRRVREHTDQVLRDSAFAEVHVATFRQELRHGVDDVVGAQLTYSRSTPEALGADLPAFVATLRAELLGANPSGVFVERATTNVLVGRRQTG